MFRNPQSPPSRTYVIKQMTGDTKDPPAAADASVAEEAVEQEGGAPKKPSTGGLKKGPWTSAEDEILVAYVKKHGEGNWNRVQRNTGLARCGKSCRLRWANHLRPNLKKGSFSRAEEELILRLHAQMGNKWARMALQLPGRTDNEIKNFWNTRIKRLQRAGQPVYPPEVYNPQIPMSTPPIGFIPDKPKFTARRPPPLLDTITFGGPPNAGMSAMPPLQRGPYMGPLSFPFSPIGPPSTPTSLFQPPPQQQLQQQQQAAQMSFGLGSCDATLMPSFSPKMELPSSQFIYSDPQISGTIAAGPGDLHLQDVGTATIPDEFKFPHLFPDELHTTVEKDSGWSYIGGGGADGLFPIDGCGGGGIDASMMNSNLESDIKPGFLGSDFDYGINAKYEPAGIPNPMHDDLSSICSVSNMDMMQISECDNINDIRQISNVKSSAMNVDLFSLGTDPLDSSLSIAPVDQDWSFDSCPWSNMPGIC